MNITKSLNAYAGSFSARRMASPHATARSCAAAVSLVNVDPFELAVALASCVDVGLELLPRAALWAGCCANAVRAASAPAWVRAA